jgi:mono/diheme cytochrome c family protein
MVPTAVANVPAVRRPGVSIAVLAVAALSAACGGTGVGSSANVDTTKGKQLFQQKCGGCHVLSDAGTSGTVGPNLDEAYAGSRLEGLEQSSFEALVRQQIDEADPPMPRHLVTGADAADVAAYVASVAGVKLAQQYNPGTTPP